ncbi:MAG: ATP-dependent helicase, partial [Planctomycetes bacterium]|nr:ATP-dependent helicase [Planctomycetota bacterium]
ALDADQRRAAESAAGPLLILAGPGTGKTRTLTHRIAGLVAERGAPAASLLAITFTRRAADEMRERLARLLGPAAAAVSVLTFHALGQRIVREHAALLGVPADFRIEPAPESAEEEDTLADRCARGALAYDDLITLPLALFDAHPQIAAAWQTRFPHISVDEFQDLDEAQYRLLLHLAPPGPATDLCVIGDPDQAIYGFRGSDAHGFERFRTDYPDARAVSLTLNYRSERAILEGAKRVVAPASRVPERVLSALADTGVRIEVHDAPSDRAEAEFVVRTIEELIGGTAFFALDSERAAGQATEALAFNDIAVLYRTAAQADVLVEALARSGHPFQRRAHGPLAESHFVHAVLAQLRDLPETGDTAARLEVALAAAQRSLAGGASDTAPAPADGEALRLLPALRALAARSAGVREFAAELALATDADLWDPRAACISLMTLHAAKGLEFPVVFITGCEDGVLPLRFGGRDEPDASAEAAEAEERRLLFVGMTRARRRLFLSHAARRRWRGKVRPMEPSPFLRQISEDLRRLSHTEAKPKPKPSPYQQLDLF